MRRSVLGLALCTVLFGCSKAEDGLDTEVGAYSLFDPVAMNPALCGGGAVPFPNNAFFAAATLTGVTTDTTLNIPSAASTAVAANLTDGFSTVGSAFTDVLGAIDFASASNGGIIVLEADATPRILVPGVDYTLQTSPAMAALSGTGGAPPSAPTCSANPLPARFLPIAQQRTRILIEPLKPLRPSTNYIVAVTKNLRSTDGVPTTPNEFFPILNSDATFCRTPTDPVTAVPLCSDAAALTYAAAIFPLLGSLDPGGTQDTPTANDKLLTAESLRRAVVRPTVNAFKSLVASPTTTGGPLTITDNDLVIAWSFTTQSISAPLATLNAIATAKAFAVGNTGFSTGDLGVDPLDRADIWAGTLNAVPYYLDDPASANDFASQCYTGVPGAGTCNAFWANNGTPVCNSPASCAATGGFVPWTPLGNYDNDGTTAPTPAYCTVGTLPFNWAAPASTTNCFRIPLERSQENLLVMVTVPNNNVCTATPNAPPLCVGGVVQKPAAGWPVVIFQHGITGNRTQALPVAGTLAGRGFVVVSIDLPLHGLVPAGSVATCGATSNNAFYAPGAERTFDLDLVTNATGAFVPDNPAIVDCSGTHFINLSSLITSRDNLRQAVADLIHLVKSLQAADPMNLDGAAGDDIDETNIYYAGISLGSIVGTTLLGVNTDIKAASLSVPGGGMAKLLDASATFGGRIAAGLAGVAFSTNLRGQDSPFEGTDTYETFVRFAQHLTDPGDPINYAVAANAAHRIHMTEVIGDTVVPNSAFSTCPATSALAAGIGATAVSNATADTRQAACLAGGRLVGANAATGAPTNLCPTITTVGVCAGNTAQDETMISGFLSGTEPLFGEMAIATILGPITPPGTANNQANANGFDAVVQFATGSHGSLLDPTASAATTCEMQRQMASFLASNGTALTVGGACP